MAPMSIKVVCGCGFCTLLPSEWAGKRVKCKCGRSFVVGQSVEVVEAMLATAPSEPVPPPLAASPPQPEMPLSQLEPVMPEVLPGPLVPPQSASPTPAPSPVDTPLAAQTVRHPRRPQPKPRSAGPILVSVLLIVLAGLSITGLTLVLSEHEWSLAGLMGSAAKREPSETEEPEPADMQAATADKSVEQENAATPASESTRLANLCAARGRGWLALERPLW